MVVFSYNATDCSQDDGVVTQWRRQADAVATTEVCNSIPSKLETNVANRDLVIAEDSCQPIATKIPVSEHKLSDGSNLSFQRKTHMRASPRKSDCSLCAKIRAAETVIEPT